MKYLLPLLFIFGCESLGVFKHEHEENGGACVLYEHSNNAPDFSNLYCYKNWTESYCHYAHNDANNSSTRTYLWTDLTCDEFCDDADSNGWDRNCLIYDNDPE